MRTSKCILLAMVALCVVWLDLTVGSPLLGFEPMEREDNETAGRLNYYEINAKYSMWSLESMDSFCTTY